MKKFMKSPMLRVAALATVGFAFAGLAQADNSLTPAGQEVSNTFVLNYNVGTTAQAPITNDNTSSAPAGSVLQGTPTEFTVDRKVDHSLTQTNSPLGNIAPSSTATLTFDLFNEGNDTQAYSFELRDLDNGAGSFDASNYEIRVTLDPNNTDGLQGPPTVLTSTPVGTAAGSASISVDIPKGVQLLVEVVATIPGGVTDGQSDQVTVIAEARNPTSWLNDATTAAGAVTQNSSGLNVIVGVAQNVLADDVGVAAVEATVSDGLHAAQGLIEIASPDLLAAKTVSVISELIDNVGAAPSNPASACSTATVVAESKSIPGACIEYVIEVTNGGSTSASNLNIADILSDDVTFVAASATGDFADDPGVTGSGPSIAQPASDTDCDGTSGTCEIVLSDTLLAAGDTGQLRIRALVK
ncbi:MAG: hypothetical protein AAF296_07875 [Pseudomonadota bacterium]